MPSYVYQCTDCDFILDDIVHSIHEDPQINCPMCDAKMERAVTSCRFEVKGFSLRKNRVKLEQRMRERENRPEWKAMSDAQKGKMKQIVDKYGSSGVWTTDTKKTRRRPDRTSIQKAKEVEEKKLRKSKAVKEVKID